MIYSLKTKRKVHPRYAALNEDEREMFRRATRNIDIKDLNPNLS
jgi:hypothetical protein